MTENVNGAVPVMMAVVPLLATTADPFQLIPLSAGFSGAMLSVWYGKRTGETITKSQSALALFSGFAAVLYIAPWMCDCVPSAGFRLQTLIYLVIGISGSAIIDQIYLARKYLAQQVTRRIIVSNLKAGLERDQTPVLQPVPPSSSKVTKMKRDDETTEAAIPLPAEAARPSN